MWWTCHQMNFYSTFGCMYQPFNNNQVLETLVLDKKGMLCFINKPGYPCSAIVRAPDEVHVFSWFKIVPIPVSFKTQNNFFYFMWMTRNDGVIPSFGQVFCFPV